MIQAIEVNKACVLSVLRSMKHILLDALEALLAVKRQRLSLARSLWSRNVVCDEMQKIQSQIDKLRAQPL